MHTHGYVYIFLEPDIPLLFPVYLSRPQFPNQKHITDLILSTV